MPILDYLYSLLQGFFRALGLEGKEGKLLLLGLDNAGKTTLLNRLRTGGIRNYPPTDRPTDSSFEYMGITFQAWDLGGHEAVRHIWGDYLCEAKALLFLIDSTDVERLEESGYELDAILDALQREREEEEDEIPVAILLNKCDLPFSEPTESVKEKIQYQDLVELQGGEHRLQIFRISVLNGTGYKEAFQWISKFL